MREDGDVLHILTSDYDTKDAQGDMVEAGRQAGEENILLPP